MKATSGTPQNLRGGYRLDGSLLECSDYVTPSTEMPDRLTLDTNTFIARRHDLQWRGAFHRAFGKREREEFYDLKEYADQMINLATDPAYAAEKEKYATQLMKRLHARRRSPDAAGTNPPARRRGADPKHPA